MWTSAGGDRGTTINHVRLCGTAGLEPLSARLRATRAIEHAAGDVTLPGSAILCVRRLRDPRPRQVTLSAVQSPRAEWTRAVEAALLDLARGAARPVSGPIDPNSDAVLFDDCAQLLACLGADWCRGSLASSWWWRALVGTAADAEAVLRAWRRHPEHIAGAIEDLAATGHVTSFVRRLSEAGTATLLDAVVRAHGLSAQLIAPGMIELRTEVAEAEIPSSPPSLPGESSLAVDAGDVWRPAAPEACVAGLRMDQRLLVGVALTLRRAPARARSSRFVEEVAGWRTQINSAIQRPPARVHIAPVFSDTRAVDAVTPTAAPIADSAATPACSERSPSPDDDAHVAAPASILADVQSSTLRAAIHNSDAKPNSPVGRLSHADTLVETELGGAFYLLNVALALELYGDFAHPRGRRLNISIWRFVALLGQTLLRGRDGDDRLWQLLIDLAGPEESQVRTADEWRLDPAWLATFPEPTAWRWHGDDERLRVHHPAGFTVLDIARAPEQSVSDQLDDALVPYQPMPSMRRRQASAPRSVGDTGLERWLRWHAEYVRARLARALGVSAARSGDVLCRHRAQVRCSLTHVNVTFSLRDLPIVIRMSGLDRDPGWIPSADRIVSFTYV